MSADGAAYLFFDEMQYADDWELWPKILYDQKPGYRVAATGPASPVIVPGAGDSGVGRRATIPVPTLFFYEYCDILGVAERPKLAPELKPTGLVKMAAPKLSSLMHQLAPLQKHFHRYQQPDQFGRQEGACGSARDGADG